MTETVQPGKWEARSITEWERAVACFLHEVVSERILRKLYQEFGQLQDIFGKSRAELEQPLLKGVRNKTKVLDILLEACRQEDAVWNHYVRLQQRGIGVLLQGDADYPESLKNIFDPPFLLYWKGKLSLLSYPAFAIVGCRDCTEYGKTQAELIARELAQVGLVIVSGLALGVDAAAHRGTLSVPDGKTIAVLGNGLFVEYPSENRELSAEIAKKGLLLSEFPPQSPPKPHHFPRRNRIIAGLSQGVLVVEAKKKSGALITADFAIEQGREVYALPGEVTSLYSEGTHDLIQQGAKLVTGAEDILEDYVAMIHRELQLLPEPEPGCSDPPDVMQPPSFSPEPEEKKTTTKIEKKRKRIKPTEKTKELPIKKKIPEDAGLCEEEQQILQVLNQAPKTIDEIMTEVEMAPGMLLQYVLQLEIQGWIESAPGNCYKKKAENPEKA